MCDGSSRGIGSPTCVAAASLRRPMSATRSGVEDAPGIERFADAVLPGAFRPDEQGADVEPREPLPDDLGTEVGAIVGPEVGRAAPRAVSFRASTIGKHSRVHSSRMVISRKARPSWVRSVN